MDDLSNAPSPKEHIKKVKKWYKRMLEVKDAGWTTKYISGSISREIIDKVATVERGERVSDMGGTNKTSNYGSLSVVLNEAFMQASQGKGLERHANGESFENQLICLLERMGLSFCEGQAVKKIVEAHRTGSEEDKLGAIVYIAANIIVSREGK